MNVSKAVLDLRDALAELKLCATGVERLLEASDFEGAANDALEGELALKLDLVKECAKELDTAITVCCYDGPPREVDEDQWRLEFAAAAYRDDVVERPINRKPKRQAKAS